VTAATANLAFIHAILAATLKERTVELSYRFRAPSSGAIIFGDSAVGQSRS
jgi:hypothetical protein